jgi:hypothetical protein
MNKFIILVVFAFMQGNTWGYIPTAESLFRNGNNVDIGTNTIVGIMNIDKINVLPTSELTNERISRNAIKVIIGHDEINKQKLIQVDYRDGIVADTTINRIHNYQNFNLSSMGLLASNRVEAAIFYSLLSSLLTNNSTHMIDLLKAIDGDFRDNRDLINKDQENLLRQYRYYLSRLSKDEDNSDLSNPLEPESEEAREKVKTIMNTSFLINNGQVKRIYEKNKFYWDISTEKIYARFDGENHRLRRLVISMGEDKIEVDCYHYIIMGGGIEFPETIYYKDLSGQMYEIKMTKLMSIQDNQQSFTKRLQNYNKSLNELKNTNLELIKPQFVL